MSWLAEKPVDLFQGKLLVPFFKTSRQVSSYHLQDCSVENFALTINGWVIWRSPHLGSFQELAKNSKQFRLEVFSLINMDLQEAPKKIYEVLEKRLGGQLCILGL